MKKFSLLIILSFLFTSNSFGQEKQYVVVPIKIYKNNRIDIYGLSSKTNQLFAKAGYIVLTDNVRNWPEELQNNPCQVLYIETEDVSPLIGLTKVKLTIQDCYKRTICQSLGKDNDIEDIKALHIALKEAFDNLQQEGKIKAAFASLPQGEEKKAIKAMLLTPSKPIAQKEAEKKQPTAKGDLSMMEQILKSYWKNNVAVAIEGIYSYANNNYFIKKNGQIYELYNKEEKRIATLKESSLPNIYKVMLKEGKLLIEKTQDNSTTVLSLVKLFPDEK